MFSMNHKRNLLLLVVGVFIAITFSGCLAWQAGCALGNAMNEASAKNNNTTGD